MKSSLLLLPAATLVLAAAASACSGQKADTAYTLDAQLPDDVADSTMIYMVNYDNGEKIDSARAASSSVSFAGTVEQPAMVRLIADGGRRMGQFILEPGRLTLSREGATRGGHFNDVMNVADSTIQARIDAMQQGLNPDSITPEQTDLLQQAMQQFYDSLYLANRDNIIGAMVFMNNTYDMSYDSLAAALEANPSLKGYKRIRNALASKQAAIDTSEGKPFKDFTITYPDSASKSLSDYAGKGHPVLVDFWASWCGPCRRETKVIKEILDQYGPKGLEVLGVAVWDEPENTLEAIDQLSLPWEQILNAQNVPTDLYGIEGIPTILLIDSDGTIVSRGKQGDELRAAVASLMEPAPKQN